MLSSLMRTLEDRRAADHVPARHVVVTVCLCDRNTFESRVDYFKKRKMCVNIPKNDENP